MLALKNAPPGWNITYHLQNQLKMAGRKMHAQESPIIVNAVLSVLLCMSHAPLVGVLNYNYDYNYN